MMKTTKAVMNDYIRRRGLFQLRDNTQGFPLVFMFIPQKKKTVESLKDNSGLETCHDREKWKMAKAEIGTETRKPGGSKPLSDGGQSSHDTWDHAKPEGKWKEISAEFDVVGTTVIEKKNTWHKRSNESSKRETELYTITLHHGRKCGHRRKTRRKRSM